MGKSHKNNYLIQGTILAVSSIVVRFIGMLYRIPMTRIIGDEGMGAYTAAYELYNLALILSSYSIPLAVSKLVSAREARKEYRNAYRVFLSAISVAVFVGLAGCLIIFFGADFWAKFGGEYDITIPLKVLSPTIFVFALMGVIRGLFQGKNTMLPTAVSQILEQLVNAAVSISAAYALMKEHNASAKIASYGAAGGTAGTLAGAIAALFFLIIIFSFYYPYMKSRLKKDNTGYQETYGDTLKVFLLTVCPIILSQTVYQLSGFVDMKLFGNLMTAQGMSMEERTALYGVYSNKYRQLTNLPVALATALGTAIVPTLSVYHSKNDMENVRQKIASSVKLNMLISIPASVGMAVLADPIIQIIYTNRENFELSVNLLRLGSVAVVVFALSTLTNGILQGINQMKLPVIHSGISLGVHIILLVFFLYVLKLDVYGLLIGNVTFALLVCILNWFSVAKYAEYKQEVYRTFILPAIASGIMGAAAFIIYKMIHGILHSITFSFLITVIIAVMIYFILILLFKAITKEEMLELPKGKLLLSICHKFHLM